VSRTHSVRRAELKALQLAMAQLLGLRVPRTLVTNNPDAIAAFYDACQGNVVLKSVSRGMIEEEPHQIGRFIYTSKVEKAHLSSLEGVRVTAHLLQEHIAKSVNIRVVVIGKQVFAAEIHSPHLDFRQNYEENTYDVHTLPGDIEQKVLSLVRGFDVQISSMDLLLTAQGEYVFIDLNPNGQWFFLQRHLQNRLPLKEAMADLLVTPKDYSL
jgi:glutathione synthase/RimK-type ligase-like ATP-grasp enzyme